MRYSKWQNETIAEIKGDYSVEFLSKQAAAYANPDSQELRWTSERFAEFLSGRIVSCQRRDIERILFRCGLSGYDIFKLAERTRAINAKDLLWIAEKEEDNFEDAITDVFESIFINFLTLQDDRHLSNFAIKIDCRTRKESFYPLYDNGRSLFYQDNEKTIRESYKNPEIYSTAFGAVGTYYDSVSDILSANPQALSLIDLSITDDESGDTHMPNKADRK